MGRKRFIFEYSSTGPVRDLKDCSGNDTTEVTYTASKIVLTENIEWDLSKWCIFYRAEHKLVVDGSNYTITFTNGESNSYEKPSTFVERQTNFKDDHDKGVDSFIEFKSSYNSNDTHEWKFDISLNVNKEDDGNGITFKNIVFDASGIKMKAANTNGIISQGLIYPTGAGGGSGSHQKYGIENNYIDETDYYIAKIINCKFLGSSYFKSDKENNTYGIAGFRTGIVGGSPSGKWLFKNCWSDIQYFGISTNPYAVIENCYCRLAFMGQYTGRAGWGWNWRIVISNSVADEGIIAGYYNDGWSGGTSSTKRYSRTWGSLVVPTLNNGTEWPFTKKEYVWALKNTMFGKSTASSNGNTSYNSYMIAGLGSNDFVPNDIVDWDTDAATDLSFNLVSESDRGIPKSKDGENGADADDEAKYIKFSSSAVTILNTDISGNSASFEVVDNLIVYN